MAKPPRDRALHGSNTYFVTANTFDSHSLFQSAQLATLFVNTLFEYRRQGRFLIHEFVVMPNHFHILLTPAPGVSLERAMQFIRGGFSYCVAKELGKKGEIWQRGYVDHRIRDAEDYVRHVEYVRMNPVRGHLVEIAEEYLYSSARPGSKLDPPPQGLKP